MPKLNFKSYGEGYPIIILHGLFGSLDNWHTFAKLLAVDYMVFTIDQRDHGRSPHTDEFNYTVLANDLLEFMDDNWIHEAIVIGHSMGGKTTMKFALDYPERVKKAVVVDIGPQTYKPRHIEIMNALNSIDLENVSSRNEINKALAISIKEEGVRQFLMKNFSRRREGGFVLKINLPLLMNNYHEINIEIQGESIDNEFLFVKGGHSNYLELEQLTKTRETFEYAEMIVIENTGHWIHAEQPILLLEAIRSFINR